MSNTDTIKFDTVEEFLAKASWEGGVAEGMQYGLRSDDLSEEAKLAHPEFARLWDEAANSLEKIQSLVNREFEMEEV